MQLQEGLAEAGGEGGSGLGDAPLGAGQLGGEAGQEVVLGLLRGQDGNRGQHAKGVGGQEDHILGVGSGGHGSHDLLDVVDGIGNAGVLSDGVVGEVAVAVLVHSHVLQQGVALDGVVDVGLGVLVQVDDLGVAAALKVEYAVVIPAVLVVANEQAFGVGGQGGLAGAGQAEEQGGVLAVHISVGGAVHGGHTLQGQVVVHHGEHALLHLAAVPGVQDDLLPGGEVEDGGGLGIQAQLLIVLHLGLGGVVGDEVRLEVLQFLSSGLDEHILDEVGLPCHLHDEADGHAGVVVGAAEHIHHKQALVGQLLLRQLLAGIPSLLRGGLVVVFELVGGPPHGIPGGVVHHNELVLGGAAGVDAGHDVDGPQVGDLSPVIALQAGLGLLLKQELIGGIADNFRGTSNTIFTQINGCHLNDLVSE